MSKTRKTFVRILNKEFSVSESKDTTCKIEARLDVPKYYLATFMLACPGFKKLCNKLPDGCIFDKTIGKFVINISGVARLHEGDEYDKEFGERLANLKARKTLFKTAAKLNLLLAEHIYFKLVRPLVDAKDLCYKICYDSYNGIDKILDHKRGTYSSDKNI